MFFRALYHNLIHQIPIRKGTTILDCLLAAKAPIGTSCGGMGTCTACLVRVKEGLTELGPRNEIEAEAEADRGFRADERLSCQNQPHEKLLIEIKS